MMGTIVFFGIPILSAVFFTVSLVRYCLGRRANKKAPESVPEKEMKMRKFWLILSLVIFVLILAFLIAIGILLAMAIAYM